FFASVNGISAKPFFSRCIMVRFPRRLVAFSIVFFLSIFEFHLPAGAQERPVTITMVPGEYMPGRRPAGVGEKLTGLAEAAREYSELHPHVTIVLRNVGGADMVEGEYIKTQIQGGIAPDIVQVNTETVWPNIHMGWWVAMDEFFDRPNPYAAADEP